MLSKGQVSFIRSLRTGKYREEHQSFSAEGPKLAEEILSSNLEIQGIYALESWVVAHPEILRQFQGKLTIISSQELTKISNLTTPNEVIVVAGIPTRDIKKEELCNGISILLDDIRDPGNLGTIIRLADWFGIERIICSKQTVDMYNPKVVQSSMGSITRVNVYYEELREIIESNKGKIRVYSAVMDGRNIYTTDIQDNAFIVIGNESHGISDEIALLSDEKISIPFFRQGAESLNASVAAAIVISEFKRKSYICATNPE
ncbi:MAG: RNA methyltransferase [Bacteroidetes bacterium]|nr:RNA methyltransferase [Bacteroidota bacterium]